MGKRYKKTILNNPEKIFLSMCGTENNFPLLRKSIKDKAALQLERDEMPGGFEDIVYIDYASFNRDVKRLSLRIVVSLQEKASIIMTDIHVMTKDGKELGLIKHTACDTNRDTCWYHMEDISPEMIAGSILDIKAQTSWQTKASGTVQAIEIEDEYVVNINTNVSEIMLKAPVHVCSTEDDYITVAYNRQAMQREIIDYSYRYDIRPEGQFLFLDCGGEVILDSKQFSEVYSYNMLIDSYNGVAIYNNEEGFRAEKINNGFKWNFNNQWNRYVPSRRLPLKDPVIFRLRIEFYCEGETDPDSILISGDLEEISAKNEKKISLLKMLWGCVAEDTHVRMADGSLRFIRDIKSGDMVIGKDYRPQRVIDVITGYEKTLQVTETTDGHRIMTTHDHPFITEAGGAVQAGSLTGKDRVLMEDEKYSNIASIYEMSYEGKVYNLILEGEQDNTVFCNGFVTGEFLMQNKICAQIKEKKRDEIKGTPLEEELMGIKKYREHISGCCWKYGR